MHLILITKLALAVVAFRNEEKTACHDMKASELRCALFGIHISLTLRLVSVVTLLTYARIFKPGLSI